MKVDHPLVDKAIAAVNKLVKSWGYKRRSDETRRLNYCWGGCMTLGDFRVLTEELPDDALIETIFVNEKERRQYSVWLGHIDATHLREEGKITLTSYSTAPSDRPDPDWK